MLNDYHLQFLRLFHYHKIRFLVIGGQARFTHFGIPTRDLDIWVDISNKNRPALDNSLVEWKTKYPIHSLQSFSAPLLLRPNVQIKFPDADVWYMRSDGEPAELSSHDGIDILTSIDDADFDTHHARALTKVFDGLTIAFLAQGDIDKISPPHR